MSEASKIDPADPHKPAPVVRGVSAEILDRPAGSYLASLRWDGRPGDPDKLSAAAFLSRL